MRVLLQTLVAEQAKGQGYPICLYLDAKENKRRSSCREAEEARARRRLALTPPAGSRGGPTPAHPARRLAMASRARLSPPAS